MLSWNTSAWRKEQITIKVLPSTLRGIFVNFSCAHFDGQKHAEEAPLPDNDDDTVLVGCKKAGNVNRFYDRTAGLFAVVRPCGVIVNFTEMFTCESATQAYIFLYTTFGRNMYDLERLRYLGYDRACGLHPFLKNLEARGSLGAKILLSKVKFLVDLFHCNKHTELCCMPPENPLCQYHPHLSAFTEIHGVNTECAEQAFKWLGRFKFHTRKMTRHRYCFFCGRWSTYTMSISQHSILELS